MRRMFVSSTLLAVLSLSVSGKRSGGPLAIQAESREGVAAAPPDRLRQRGIHHRRRDENLPLLSGLRPARRPQPALARIRHRGALRRQPPGGVGTEAGRQHDQHERSAAAVPDADRTGQQAGGAGGEQGVDHRAGRGAAGAGRVAAARRWRRGRAAAAAARAADHGFRIRQGLDGRCRRPWRAAARGARRHRQSGLRRQRLRDQQDQDQSVRRPGCERQDHRGRRTARGTGGAAGRRWQGPGRTRWRRDRRPAQPARAPAAGANGPGGPTAESAGRSVHGFSDAGTIRREERRAGRGHHREFPAAQRAWPTPTRRLRRLRRRRRTGAGLNGPNYQVPKLQQPPACASVPADHRRAGHDQRYFPGRESRARSRSSMRPEPTPSRIPSS